MVAKQRASKLSQDLDNSNRGADDSTRSYARSHRPSLDDSSKKVMSMNDSPAKKVMSMNDSSAKNGQDKPESAP